MILKKRKFPRKLTGAAAALFALLFLLGCPPFKSINTSAEGAREGSRVSSSLEASSSNEDEAPQPEAANTGGEEDALAVQVSLPPASLIRSAQFAIIPPNAAPGEPVTVGYSDDFSRNSGLRGLQAVLLDSRGRRLTRAVFFDLQNDDYYYESTQDGNREYYVLGRPELKAALLAVPVTAAAGNAILRIESADGVIKDLPFTINPREFISETISLNQENTDIRIAPNPQRTRESEQLWAVLSRTGTTVYSGEKYIPPVSSTRRTSFFGDTRTYQYVDGSRDSSIHAGIDYGVPTGTEVRACAPGRVVMARERIVTGFTVVMEHLPGVYSLYYHLDSLAVSEGNVCEEGALLGMSGSTGLSTGPHLHWEMRVAGEYADPDIFLARPVLDKTDILNKLTNY